MIPVGIIKIFLHQLPGLGRRSSLDMLLDLELITFKAYIFIRFVWPCLSLVRRGLINNRFSNRRLLSRSHTSSKLRCLKSIKLYCNCIVLYCMSTACWQKERDIRLISDCKPRLKSSRTKVPSDNLFVDIVQWRFCSALCWCFQQGMDW